MRRPVCAAALFLALFAATAAAAGCSSAAEVRGGSGSAGAGGGAAARAAGAGRAIEHVIVVSIDGLMPEAYLDPAAHELAIPTLRKMVAGGVHSTGLRSVFPTLTFPAHTSMVTGTDPLRHGIYTNRAWDPTGQNQGGWRWYAEAIQEPTLWDMAAARALPTALINWPVSVGANATYLLPDFWRAGTADDTALLRALSTRGLLAKVARRFPDFSRRWDARMRGDSTIGDVAVYLIEQQCPALMLVHLLDVDHQQHATGLWTPAAIEAIEAADRQVGRLIEALEAAGVWEKTALVVVSDHGFRAYQQKMGPGVLLKQHELITFSAGPTPKVESWKAALITNGGTAYIYVRDAADAGTRQALDRIFAPMAGKPGTGVEKVWSAAEIRAAGGDPNAYIALEAAPGFNFDSVGYDGPVISPSGYAGHGWPPERPDMAASFVAYGPSIEPGRFEGGRLVDLAPTVAAWLALPMSGVDGKPLPVQLRAR